jgi:hypothetical protein
VTGCAGDAYAKAGCRSPGHRRAAHRPAGGHARVAVPADRDLTLRPVRGEHFCRYSVAPSARSELLRLLLPPLAWPPRLPERAHGDDGRSRCARAGPARRSITGLKPRATRLPGRRDANEIIRILAPIRRVPLLCWRCQTAWPDRVLGSPAMVPSVRPTRPARCQSMSSRHGSAPSWRPAAGACGRAPSPRRELTRARQDRGIDDAAGAGRAPH